MSRQAQQTGGNVSSSGTVLSKVLDYPSPPLSYPRPASPALGYGRIGQTLPRFPSAESLLDEWLKLATRAQAAPYLHPGWAAAWWHAFGTGTPEIRTLRRDGRLVALLPMIRRHDALESAANYHSPGFGLLAEDAAAVNALAQELFADKPAHICITSLDPGADSFKACLTAAKEAGYRVKVRPYQRSLYLELKGSWDEYESGLGRNLLRNLRRYRKRLEQEGKLSIEISHGKERFDELMAETLAVEASGWKGARRTAIASHPRTRSFYTEMGRWAAAQGMLRLFFLRLDGRPLAVYFALEHRGLCHLLKGGYDPAYSHCSPGNLLMHSVIRNGFTNSLSRIEFNGDAEAYKFSWAAAVRECKRFEAFAPTTAGRLAWAESNYIRPVKRRLLRCFGINPDREI